MDGNDKYVGRVLDNRYEILELIGTGGMALVYKARCHRLNRMVAIKILKEDLANDDDFRRRFHTESQAVAMLSHPNIVAVYDVSRSGNVEYIIMELIEGITLKQYINRKGLLNWKEALHFATQVTKALSHAHSRGIIHRDIKPHNIMILKDGSVKVADFGIARLLSVQNNTLTQETLGSVHYISPEQAKGGYIDARSDIYSVGVVIYEMLTSRLPFVGDSAVSVAIQHISAMPLMPRDINPDIPVGLENITMHAMEPDLALRFTTAEEMLYDLEEFRKNPAIIFDYTMSGPHNRHSEHIIDQQETKAIPSGRALAKIDRPAPQGNKQQNPQQQSLRQPSQRVSKKPEITPEQHRETSKRASSTSTLVGICGIILFIVVLVVFMWNFLLRDIFGSADEEMITIPNFINLRYDDVIRDSRYQDHFNFTAPAYMPSTEHAAGIIISQSPSPQRQQSAPAPGRRIDIELTVSSGGETPVLMPDLRGIHYSEARNRLVNLSLELEIVLESVVSDLEMRDRVVETIPASGGVLARGNTVIIVYGSGQNRVSVPDLRGRTVEMLESAFELAGLIPDLRFFPDPSEEGTVLFIQGIGDEVAVGTVIVVHISSGPPEAPTVIVPDLRGSSRAVLESTFNSLGLTPDIRMFEDPTDEGTVIYISSIGEEVPVGTTITVHISSGPPAVPTVFVPDLRGSSRDVLELTFQSLGLTPDIRVYEDQAIEGTVLFIARIGEEVPVGTIITVHISAGLPNPSSELPGS